MRPTPAVVTGRIRPLVLLLAFAASACDSPVEPGRVRRLELSVPATQLQPGFYMHVIASPLDAAGHVVEDFPVKWRSLTPATLDVTEDGLMLALAPGVGIARATAGAVHADLHLDLVNPPIEQLTLDEDTLALQTPGSPGVIVARALDAAGIALIAPELEWESSASRIATVTSAGLVSPVAVGRSTITVRGGGLVASTEVIVSAQPSGTAPIIAGVAPSAMSPGQTVVLTGSGFSPTPSANTVLVDGTPVTVTAASVAQLTLQLPAASAFVCQPARTVALQVGTPGGIGVTTVDLTVAPLRTLGVGQSMLFTSAAEARCNEFAPAAGRYLITVPNAARALGAGAIAVQLRGEATFGGAQLAAAEGIAARNAAAAFAAAAPRRALDPEWLRGRRERARDRAHARILEANAAVSRTVSTVAPLLRSDVSAPTTARILGTIVPVRIPDLASARFCFDHTPINARVVYVGEHVTLLEDTATVANGNATVAGQMDGDFATLGAELDLIGWQIANKFGDPLVMDDRLDDNASVTMVFSPRMNNTLGGSVLASVVNCDFHPRSVFPSSNVGEYVYAQVPTSLSDAMIAGSRALWRHEIRGTLVHELKHVTSYAERTVRGWPLEEGWLEEATARAAEEFFARAAYGTGRFANVGFGASLACEVRANDPSYPACADAPRAMRPHVEALWQFLDAPGTHSPLGGAAGDLSYYGSAWSLTRWLADQDAPNEAEFFTALTVNRQAGILNLEARSGRPWDQMLPEWTLAMVGDDYPGLVTQSPRVRFPSFDLRSIYQGLCDVVGSCIMPALSPFSRPWPLRPLALESGPFVVQFGSIEPGGFVAVDLVVSAATVRQVLELRGVGGAPLPNGARLAILRIE